MKNKIATIGIILTTLLLAGIAIFTAIRLYQLRTKSVAPNVPTSIPKAAENTTGCVSLTFTLDTSTAIPTSTVTSTPSGTSEPTNTATPTATTNTSTTPNVTATPTATTQATIVATATSQPELPVTGMSWPTILGISIGVLMILGSLVLAL